MNNRNNNYKRPNDNEPAKQHQRTRNTGREAREGSPGENREGQGYNNSQHQAQGHNNNYGQTQGQNSQRSHYNRDSKDNSRQRYNNRDNSPRPHGGYYNYGNRPSERVKTVETIDDIKADISRIEKEIQLEIKEIKSLRLGL